MADASISDVLGIAVQGAAAIITAAGSFYLGRYRWKNKAATDKQTGDHKEREQLFEHYNSLVTSTREMNHALRNEIGTVRNQMYVMQFEHAKDTAAAAVEREECRVENERLRSEVKHMKADINGLKQELAEYQSSKS